MQRMKKEAKLCFFFASLLSLPLCVNFFDGGVQRYAIPNT
jgi:hypothetical protein